MARTAEAVAVVSRGVVTIATTKTTTALLPSNHTMPMMTKMTAGVERRIWRRLRHSQSRWSDFPMADPHATPPTIAMARPVSARPIVWPRADQKSEVERMLPRARAVLSGPGSMYSCWPPAR